MTSVGQTVLAAKDLTVQRNGIQVLRGANLKVCSSEIVAVVGPNGSGKTTLLEAMSGVLKPAEGSVSLHGCDITKKSRRQRSLRGLRHVRQGRTVFFDLTVEENLRVMSNNTEGAYEIFPELCKRSHLRAKELSGGEQQMLVLAQALISQPSCLLIDEISLGLAPRIVKRLTSVVKGAAETGTAVLLVEQFASVAIDIADSVLVVVRGEVVLRERSEVLLNDPDILQNAYFGTNATD